MGRLPGIYGALMVRNISGQALRVGVCGAGGGYCKTKSLQWTNLHVDCTDGMDDTLSEMDDFTNLTDYRKKILIQLSKIITLFTFDLKSFLKKIVTCQPF